MATPSPQSNLRILPECPPQYHEILTPQALDFVAGLANRFEATRQQLLARRHERQKLLDAGQLPDFLAETASIRAADWKVAPIPAPLLDRRVEITGPVERKMIINAFNSGASVFMADFEDANSPTWRNAIEGQINLRDAIRRTIEFRNPDGKEYRLNEKTAVLLVRPRGWHLNEKHVLVDDQQISGSLFDFGLYFFHNARELLNRGVGPYFYLPKMESHLEARLWNDVFCFSQDYCGIPQGSIRATVLIETLLGAFEMDEILYELRDHSAGLNCGRWDYIFSFIKKLSNHPQFMLPDRAQVTMDRAFLEAYVRLLIHTCHRRGIHAMGGMAAQIPIKNDPTANAQALEKVRQDKLREVRAGHDGTWVAHPGLVPIAKEVFDAGMPGLNQLDKQTPGGVAAAELLKVHEGTRSEAGLRLNINVGIQYLESWLGGNGCVPINNLMEDAATAEISRAQVWQCVRHGAKLDDGRIVDAAMVRATIREELDKLKTTLGPARFDGGHFLRAAELFDLMINSGEFTEFLTLPAYNYID
ncbi:MAG: malate synthase A [Candidatus Solibacter usitatus]|nr:malate synthase A [Candidatus Solibacter usitatus]